MGVSFGQSKGKTVAPPTPSNLVTDSAKPKKPIWPLADKTKSARKRDGLFTIYQGTATASTCKQLMYRG